MHRRMFAALSPGPVAAPGGGRRGQPAETAVDPAKLAATCETIRPGLPDNRKQRIKDRMAQLRASQYTFGPGNAATAYSLTSADGSETTSAATEACDGRKITFTSTVNGLASTLDCAMRGEYLMPGKTKDKAALKKKAE